MKTKSEIIKRHNALVDLRSELYDTLKSVTSNTDASIQIGMKLNMVEGRIDSLKWMIS